MTYTEIVTEVGDRLNLTSTTALARIGRSLNIRYKQLATSLGMQTLARTVVSANTVISNQLVVFTSTVKVSSVFLGTNPTQPLDELTIDQLRNQPLHVDPPSQYAIYQTGATTVTIKLNTIPATIYAVGADAVAIVTTLSGASVPAFPENFHDLLILGAMATELDKMEKYDMANKQEILYEKRLSELRYHIAKTAYLDLYQGKTAGSHSAVQLL